MRFRFCSLAVLSVLTCVFASGEWDRFRGPNGAGVAAGDSLPAEIGKDRNLVWSVKTPAGNASPVIHGSRIYLAAHEGDDRVVLCLDVKSGATVWRRSVKKTRTETVHPLNGPTTPTPVVAGGSVFTFFPEFGLLAYDLEGRERWRVPLGPFAAVQGMAASPIYVDGRVILQVDTPEDAWLAAYDARTGKQVWRAERPTGFLGGYSTPAVYTPAGQPAQIIVAGASELTAYAARTGERIWWAHNVTVAPAAPVTVTGDSVYTVEPGGEAGPSRWAEWQGKYDKNKDGKIELTELGESVSDRIMFRIFKSMDKFFGDGDGAVTEPEIERSNSAGTQSGGLVRTRIDGKGDVSKTNVLWRHTRGVPYTTAPVLYGDTLYVVRNGGVLLTFDPADGKMLRQDRLKGAAGEYYASPVAGDGKLYFVNKDGQVTVIKAGRDWEVVSSADLEEQVIATPAITGGRIFLRTAGTLYCFGRSL